MEKRVDFDRHVANYKRERRRLRQRFAKRNSCTCAFFRTLKQDARANGAAWPTVESSVELCGRNHGADYDDYAGYTYDQLLLELWDRYFGDMPWDSRLPDSTLRWDD